MLGLFGLRWLLLSNFRTNEKTVPSGTVFLYKNTKQVCIKQYNKMLIKVDSFLFG